ncbi:MAG: hypothetical protein RIE53_11335 [Rhodothermales bacterium]
MLGGCDSEALVLSSSDQDDRALAALGTDHAAMFRVDVRGLMAESDAVLAMLPAEAGAMWQVRMQEIAAATGMDPQQDMDVVWLAVGDDYGSAVAFAEHDPTFLTTALPHRTTMVGHDVYHPEDASGMQVASWQGDVLLATSTEPAMRRALEAFQSNAPAPSLPTEAARVRSADAWVHVRDMPALLASMPDAGGDLTGQLRLLLGQVQSGAAGLVVNNGSFSFQLVGRPVASTTPDDLASVLKGVVAIAKMQPDLPAEFLSIVEGIDIAARDGFVTVELTLSAEAAAALLASMQE